MSCMNNIKSLSALFSLVIITTAGCSLFDSAYPGDAEVAKNMDKRHIFNPGEWTIDDGLSGALIIGAQISPDGSKVAYTVARAYTADGINNWFSEVRVAGIGNAKTQHIGMGSGMLSSPLWSPDGAKIGFLAPVQEGYLKGTQQLFIYSEADDKTERLTNVPNGIILFIWSPDSSCIAFTSPEIPEPRPGRAGVNDDAEVQGADTSAINLWIIDAKPGTEPRRLTKAEYVIEDFDWAPDGKSIAFTHLQASAPEGWHQDISIIAINGGKLTKLAGTPAAEITPLFSPDGSTIAYIKGDNPTADFSGWRVELVPTPGSKGGITRTLAITPNEMPVLVSWSPDSDYIFFEEFAGTAHCISVLPVSGGMPIMLSSPDQVLGSVSLSADGRNLGFTMQDFNHPQEVYIAPAVKQGKINAQRITNENEDIAKMPVPKIEILSWKSTDGMMIEGMLSYPLNYEKGRQYPLILSIHGGPAETFTQSYFGQPDVYPYAVWAGQGYAVLRVNPRGSNGYGAAFRKANIADWDGGPYNDLMTGVDKIIGMGVADPGRLVVVGWSYGGHMTANITTRNSRFKAAVVGAGPVNLVSQSGISDLPEMIPAYMSGYSWEKPEVYLQQSPIFSAGKVKTPTLILHGKDDTRVPFSQGEEWQTALRALGVKSELVGYPRSGHVVREPQLMKDLQLRVIEWIDTHLCLK